MKMRRKETRKGGIILEVAVLFLVGVLTTGFLTYFSEQNLSRASISNQTELRAEEYAAEVQRSVMEYPAYRWLLRYWYTHSDTLEIEYDVEYASGTKTEAKAQLLAERHPGLQLKYADASSISALPEEDQKLYAEVAYSWLITRINQIKRSYNIDYLFCVASAEPFDTQFFLFSGAEENSVRGTEYEQVYPLGNIVTVAQSQQEAMAGARRDSSHLADAGDYVDYYSYLCSFDEQAVFLGFTYSLRDLRADMEAQTRTGTLYAVLNQILLSVLCLGLLYLFVLRPLRKVQKNIRQYRQTKESAPVIKSLSEIAARNEIGELSEDVQNLAKEIDDHLEKIQAITAEKERISAELSLATRIQAAMLPHIFPAFPDRSEFDIYASMDPAKEVGGDFYDYFLVDDDHLCMVMADVSGKGVPAALFMMASKIMLQSYAMLGKSPAEILTMTNQAICSNNQEEMFVTVWVGILELSTGKLAAANAGHEYPVLKQPDGSFALYKDKHGLVIGGMEGVRYKEYELQLQPGTKLFLYTDGVPEATSADTVLFGTDRMLEALNAAQDKTPEEILKVVRSAVDGFVQDAEQFDDLTMLCMEYFGKDGQSR